MSGGVCRGLDGFTGLGIVVSGECFHGALRRGATRLEARAPASRAVVEPLRQMTPPADRRGSRILTAMVSMASVENAMRTTERAANRLSEEQLYEQIRRVGAVGAAVNVKF